jgi:hypothetical protein
VGLWRVLALVASSTGFALYCPSFLCLDQVLHRLALPLKHSPHSLPHTYLLLPPHRPCTAHTSRLAMFLRSGDQVVDFSCGENYFVPYLKKLCLRWVNRIRGDMHVAGNTNVCAPLGTSA